MVVVYAVSLSILISGIPLVLQSTGILTMQRINVFYGFYHGILTFLAVLAIVGVVLKRRDNKQVRNAWLYFLVGVILFIPTGITKTLIREELEYLTKIMFLISMVPIFFFTLSISKPMRMLFLPRKRVRLIVIVSLLIILILSSLIIVPLIFGNYEFIRGGKTSIFHLLDLFFHIVLLIPVIELLFIFGINEGNFSYLLISLGFLAGVFAYFPSIYQFFLSSRTLRGLAVFFGTLEISLFMMGAILEIGFCRESTPRESHH